MAGRPRKSPIETGSNPGNVDDTVNPVSANSGATLTIDPGAIDGLGGSDSGTGSGGTGKRKYTRKAKGGSSGAKVHVNASTISGFLYSIHKMLGAKIPEMELERVEADALGESLANVEALYDVKASEKAIAWGALCVTAFGIYGQRAVAIKLRTLADKSTKARVVNPASNPQQQPQPDFTPFNQPSFN